MTLTLSPIGVEALDDPATDPALVTRMLHDIARANRWLGGVHALQRALDSLLADDDRGSALTLCDIGTGAGDLPVAAVRYAARRGVALRPLGIERTRAAADVANTAGVSMVIACAGAPPLADASVDIVLLSQVLHHLDGNTAITLLAACARIARRGVIVTDLRRSAAAALGWRFAARTLGLHRTTIDDGLTSIERGYSVQSLRDLCVAAGIHDANVYRSPIGRIVACWKTR